MLVLAVLTIRARTTKSRRGHGRGSLKACYLFPNFKLNMHQSSQIRLGLMPQAALERMTVTQAVKTEDVTWVLTVPVCCSEPAKHFMRQAAIQAGYIKGGDDDEVSD